MPKLTAKLDDFLSPAHKQKSQNIVVLTGAGISAESGIPTFRGQQGYWTIGSTQYQPQEMATWQMFSQAPWSVWTWYLYRHFRCRSALPNPAHYSLANLQKRWSNRVTLITQNVDGLHLRAGSPLNTTYQIHGNIDFMRCANRCTDALFPLEVPPKQRDAKTELTADEKRALHCPSCNALMRPHVLWFDECYEEELYRAQSALNAASKADLIIVIGTTGTTSLPSQIGNLAQQQDIPLIDINPKPNFFGHLTRSLSRGLWLKANASDALPQLVEALVHQQD